MTVDILRNAEHYVDKTAFQAIKQVIETGTERENKNMDIYRGDIWKYTTKTGVERIALVVSADFRNDGKFVSIIVLQDESKGFGNVPIATKSKLMYAECGLVSFTEATNMTEFIKQATEAEMRQVDEAISECLGIETKEIIKEITVERQVDDPAVPAPVSNANEELMNAKAEAKVYKDMYESLLAKVIK